MANKFKPIRLEDLRLSPKDMKAIAEGAALFMAPPADDEEAAPVVETEPLVTRRPLVDE